MSLDDAENQQQELTPETPLAGSFPHVEGERRKEQDRRQTERQGKYDRRKNRCVHCVHFREEAVTGKGTCLFHQTDMVAYAFACPNFEAIQPEPKR